MTSFSNFSCTQQELDQNNDYFPDQPMIKLNYGREIILMELSQLDKIIDKKVIDTIEIKNVELGEYMMKQCEQNLHWFSYTYDKALHKGKKNCVKKSDLQDAYEKPVNENYSGDGRLSEVSMPEAKIPDVVDLTVVDDTDIPVVYHSPFPTQKHKKKEPLGEYSLFKASNEKQKEFSVYTNKTIDSEKKSESSRKESNTRLNWPPVSNVTFQNSKNQNSTSKSYYYVNNKEDRKRSYQNMYFLASNNLHRNNYVTKPEKEVVSKKQCKYNNYLTNSEKETFAENKEKKKLTFSSYLKEKIVNGEVDESLTSAALASRALIDHYHKKNLESQDLQIVRSGSTAEVNDEEFKNIIESLNVYYNVYYPQYANIITKPVEEEEDNKNAWQPPPLHVRIIKDSTAQLIWKSPDPSSNFPIKQYIESYELYIGYRIKPSTDIGEWIPMGKIPATFNSMYCEIAGLLGGRVYIFTLRAIDNIGKFSQFGLKELDVSNI